MHLAPAQGNARHLRQHVVQVVLRRPFHPLHDGQPLALHRFKHVVQRDVGRRAVGLLGGVPGAVPGRPRLRKRHVVVKVVKLLGGVFFAGFALAVPSQDVGGRRQQAGGSFLGHFLLPVVPVQQRVVGVEPGGGRYVFGGFRLHDVPQKLTAGGAEGEQAQALQQVFQFTFGVRRHVQAGGVRHKRDDALDTAQHPHDKLQKRDERRVVVADAHGDDAVPDFQQRVHDAGGGVLDFVDEQAVRGAEQQALFGFNRNFVHDDFVVVDVRLGVKVHLGLKQHPQQQVLDFAVEQTPEAVVGQKRQHQRNAHVRDGEGRHERLGVLLGEVVVEAVNGGRMQHVVFRDPAAAWCAAAAAGLGFAGLHQVPRRVGHVARGGLRHLGVVVGAEQPDAGVDDRVARQRFWRAPVGGRVQRVPQLVRNEPLPRVVLQHHFEQRDDVPDVGQLRHGGHRAVNVPRVAQPRHEALRFRRHAQDGDGLFQHGVGRRHAVLPNAQAHLLHKPQHGVAAPKLERRVVLKQRLRLVRRHALKILDDGGAGHGHGRRRNEGRFRQLFHRFLPKRRRGQLPHRRAGRQRRAVCGRSGGVKPDAAAGAGATAGSGAAGHGRVGRVARRARRG